MLLYVDGSGALYPDARGRLQALARLLAGHEVEIFLAIRQLGHYSRSLYCEALWWMDGHFTAEPEHKRAWAPGRQSWQPLIGDILATFPKARVVIWPHMLNSKTPDMLLDRVSGTAGIGWSFKGAYRRPSLSTSATLALMEIGARDGTEKMREQAGALNKKFPRSPDDPTYEMWTKEENRMFQQSFNRDVAAIRKMSSRIEILKAPPRNAKSPSPA